MCGRATLLMFLLFTANTHKFLWVSGAVDENEVMHKLNQMETDQYMLVLNIKSLISQILTANNQIAYRLDKVENTLDSVKTQVQENAIAIKFNPADCQRWLKWPGVDIMNFFSADGNLFYFNKTGVTGYIARDWCAERGMQLASLKSSSQSEAVSNELKMRNYKDNQFWLSANDIGQTAGQFKWTDGSSVDSATWENIWGDPNSFGTGKDTCVWLYTRSAKLLDDSCSGNKYFLCEVPSALSSVSESESKS